MARPWAKSSPDPRRIAVRRDGFLAVIAYVDSSVILRIVLQQPAALPGLDMYEGLVTSTLTQLECLRAVDNLRAAGGLDQDETTVRRHAVFAKLRGLVRVPVTGAVFARAEGGFPTPIATLDAIHLATALVWRERRAPDLSFVTHDRQQARAATALGFDIVGV